MDTIVKVFTHKFVTHFPLLFPSRRQGKQFDAASYEFFG